MSKKFKTIIVLTGILLPFVVVAMFFAVFSCDRGRERKYMINYMDSISITCKEYRLADPDKTRYALLIDEGVKKENTIICNGKEKKVIINRGKSGDEYQLIIDDETVTIDKKFMAEKSSEYVTITEMWYRYDDNMDNYEDFIPGYAIRIFDNSIFIITEYKRGGGAWWFRYYGSLPACLFKYDIENDTLLYGGYYLGIDETCSGTFQIEKVESI